MANWLWQRRRKMYPGIAVEVDSFGIPIAQTASEKQVGGDHYKDLKIQPAEFCYINNIPYLEATAIKYLCRWRKKGGIQDLDKAIHFIELLKEFESANNTRT